MRRTAASLVTRFLLAAGLLGCGASPTREPSAPGSPPPEAPRAALPDEARPPVPATPPAPRTPRTLAASEGLSCAIHDAAVVCWGGGGGGGGAEPVQPGPRVIAGLGPAEELVAAYGGVCARRADASVHCAARPLRGGAGREIVGLRGAVRIAMDSFLRCALFADETVRCVDDQDRAIGVAVDLTGATDLFSTSNSVCVTFPDRDALCLVGRGAQQLDVLTLPQTAGAPFVGPHRCVTGAGGARCPVLGYREVVPLAPIAGAGEPSWLGATGFPGTVWALRADASVWHSDDGAWAPSALGRATELALTPMHTCARLAEGPVRCVGENADGRSDGVGPSPAGPPTRVLGITDAIDVATARTGACALERDGALRCWTRRSTAAEPVALPEPLLELVGSIAWICGRSTAGTVHCVAPSASGAIEVVPSPSLDASRGLFGAGRLLCAFDAQGALSCQPTGAPRPPFRVPALDGALDVVVRHPEVCGRLPGGVRCVTVDAEPQRASWLVRGRVDRHFGAWGVDLDLRGGRVEAAGANELGNLGVPPPLDRSGACPGEGCPASVTRLRRRRVEAWPAFTDAALDWQRTCVWAQTGPLYCAGLRPDLTTPDGYELPFAGAIRPVPGVTDVRAVALGPTNCAVDARGAVWCWGAGHRGDGRPEYVTAPREIDLDAATR